MQPIADWRNAQLEHRGRLQSIRGISAASNLPEHIINRQQNQIEKRLKRFDSPVTIERVKGESIGQGTLVFLKAEFENVQAGFSVLGARRKPAERVADEACRALVDFLESDAVIDPHLADQLILPMALATGESRLYRLSNHAASHHKHLADPAVFTRSI